MPSETKALTLRIPAILHRRLVRFSKSSGLTQAWIIRRALLEWLNEAEKEGRS